MFSPTSKAPTWAVFALSILGNGIASVAAIASRENGCTAVDAGPFKLLYAPVNNSTDQHPLQLVGRPDPAPLDTFCTTDECSADDLTLTMINGTLQAMDSSLLLVDLVVVDNAPLRLVNDSSTPDSGAPDYCVVPNPNTSDGLPHYLAIGPEGDTENFYLCSDPIFFTQQFNDDIWYKYNASDSGHGDVCNTKVHLIIQPTDSSS